MTRRGLRSRLLACAVSGLILVPAVAGPAQAKSGIWISAVPVYVEGEATARIAVSAFGGDDAAGRQRLCVQRLVEGSWRTAVCGRVELGTGGWVRVTVPRTPAAVSWFRAVLRRAGRKGRETTDLVSAPVSPFVAATAMGAGTDAARASAWAAWAYCAQSQTYSKSAVSLSSTDNGIETASVVRSK